MQSAEQNRHRQESSSTSGGEEDRAAGGRQQGQNLTSTEENQERSSSPPPPNQMQVDESQMDISGDVRHPETPAALASDADKATAPPPTTEPVPDQPVPPPNGSNTNLSEHGTSNGGAEASAETTTTAKPEPAHMAPFRMKIQTNNKTHKTGAPKRKSRKRKLGGNLSLSGSSSSSSGGSSSSDSDEDEHGNNNNNISESDPGAVERKQQQLLQQQQHHHHLLKFPLSGHHAQQQDSAAVARNAGSTRGSNLPETASASHNKSSGGGGGGPKAPPEKNTSMENPNQIHIEQQQRQNRSGTNNLKGGNAGTNPDVQQPDGWRVKLYRLNADGSWDDCGTGRIVCLYRPPLIGSSDRSLATTPPPPISESPQQHHPDHTTSDNSILQEKVREKNVTPGGTFSENKNDSSGSDDNVNNSNADSGSQTEQWLYQETGEATLCVQAEVTKLNRQPRVLLRTRILLRDAYQRQGDNIITWCEPYYISLQEQQHGGSDAAADPFMTGGNAEATNTENSNDKDDEENSGSSQNTGVDLALSFQDNAGCLDIWRQITHVQGRASELLRRHQHEKGGNSSVEDMAARVAAQHHADLQRQQQEQNELWSPSSSQQQLHSADDQMLMRSGPEGGDIYNNALVECPQSLPHPPTLHNLEEIADTIAALQHVQQRESLAMWIAKDECAYLKSLLALFPSAEVRGDYGKLATLAACVKTILLLNDPSILELIVSVATIFEQVCSCMEYDPDLREKANHRWFLRERAKFRTVVPMEDPDLVEAIHRSFRVSYLRDTLLRPTMDESALSTLSSLQTFTYADVVKGVTMAGNEPDANLFDSYLIKVIDMLCVELHALTISEWAELEAMPIAMTEHHHKDNILSDPSIVVGKHSIGMTTWKQYLAPQDDSLSSRRMRRRGCLSFLKELFNMVRLSLQQNDKDDFFTVICSLSIDLSEVGREIADNVSQTSQQVEVGSVASTVKSERFDEKTELPHSVIDTSVPPPPTNLLSMLGSVLSDPTTDISEKGSVLEIIGAVAMHDPGLIRRHCLKYYLERKNFLAAKQFSGKGVSARPEPNEKNQVVFWCPSNDLLASLLFLLDVETDAGILLQVSEIMRIILDTDMVSDHGPMAAGFTDEAEGIPPGASDPPHQHDRPTGSESSTTDQKQFLSLFYEHYVEWLVAPFQFTILHPVRRVPDNLLLDSSDSPLLQRMISTFQKGISLDDPLIKTVHAGAVRSSFAVELMSFCVRAHLYRMKFFLLKSRVLGSILKILRCRPGRQGISGDRCLKLAALRFLRAILSVNDEFYHRHIIQHDLFDPVFEALRSNPVGDNLVSSAIIEMCDYIHSENVKSLIEYIVTRHLSTSHPENTAPSLEDVSSPYVSTLTVLRKAYEANLNASSKAQDPSDSTNNGQESPVSPGGSRFLHSERQLTGKALEDQRKFREMDQEESYFDSDDEGTNNHPCALPQAVDEVDAQQVAESELHRTPRMFSLAQAPLLNSFEESPSSDSTSGSSASTSQAPASNSINENEAGIPIEGTKDISPGRPKAPLANMR